MIASRLLALTAATSALVCSAPVMAQADPAPAADGSAAEAAETAIEYRSEAVVQALPSPPVPPPPPPPPPPDDIFESDVVEYERRTAPAATTAIHAQPALAAYPAYSAYPGIAAPHVAGSYASPYPYPYPAPHYAGHVPQPRQFDREGWLAHCRERIRGVDRKDRGAVIGGLLGAAAGGIIGNRAWDSERLAGTLLGAGVGGLAGIAIGAAIGAAGERRREDECAWHLDRYMAAGQGGYGYPGQAHGYAYGYPAVAYVPVLVQIPQRAVVREYVTEEWVDVPAKAQPVAQTKIIRQPAPRPDKRIKRVRGR